MRTIRKLSFLGILSIGIAVLFLVGISFMQAQVTTRGKPEKPVKPDKPGEEEVTWAVQIPGMSLNLWGMDKDDPPYEYVNNGKDIIVSVEKKGWMSPGNNKASGIYYILLFKLVNPTDNWVKFNEVYLSLPNTNPDERICAFPAICSSTGLDCLQCFLNKKHPYSNPDSNSEDYDHVYIKFWIWGYDIEKMNPGDEHRLGSGNWTSSSNDRIRIKTGYTPVNTCFREEPAYHDIICQKYAEDGPLNISIEKIGDNKWQIYGDVSDLPVKESYCIEKKDKGWVSKTVTTLEATGNFSFVMDWIKKSK